MCCPVTSETAAIFYPAAREALGEGEGDDLLDEAEVEHASAKELIAQIEELGRPTIFSRQK
jgi:hypothetical protein